MCSSCSLDHQRSTCKSVKTCPALTQNKKRSVLQTLKRYTTNGWLSNGDIDSLVKPYFKQRQEIVYNLTFFSKDSKSLSQNLCMLKSEHSFIKDIRVLKRARVVSGKPYIGLESTTSSLFLSLRVQNVPIIATDCKRKG